MIASGTFGSFLCDFCKLQVHAHSKCFTLCRRATDASKNSCKFIVFMHNKHEVWYEILEKQLRCSFSRTITDNFFTSIQQANELKAKTTFSVGTLRANSKVLPKNWLKYLWICRRMFLFLTVHSVRVQGRLENSSHPISVGANKRNWFSCYLRCIM